MISSKVDVLIPTYNRPAGLAVLLTSLIAQTYQDFSVHISDQSSHVGIEKSAEMAAVHRGLEAHGISVRITSHLPRRGMAEQRKYLLDQATAPLALFLDDDLILEPFVIGNLVQAIEEEGCGFVGCGLFGLSFVNEVRPEEQTVEFWLGPVQPEEVKPNSSQWQRHKLHNAANLFHTQQRRLNILPHKPRKYKVAWVGGCVLHDTEKLRGIGGFSFWKYLPRQHFGEDALAQLRVMSVYGGCGLLPSGVYHQELPTTVKDRRTDAPHVLATSVAPETNE